MALVSPSSIRAKLFAPATFVMGLGDQLAFFGRIYARIPRAMTRYRREVVRLIAEVSLGTGALALIGGTVLVVAFLTLASGIEVGLQAYTSFDHIGVGVVTGFFAAVFNTREIAPLIAGVALTATVGAGFTAQIGAMRVSEEIDALEVMAVEPMTFLIATRVAAGLIAAVPLYAVAVFTTNTATYFVTTWGFGQSGGTYGHYFQTFLLPGDLLLALFKVLLMTVLLMSICCYWGFHATGGPAGVGRAVGSAVRSSLIAIMVLDLAFAIAFWSGPSVRITG
ncbi:phospholipid/cholesterol/gamma-HCH transport system permease protein [Marmoricola sp. URHA0025 HA25]